MTIPGYPHASASDPKAQAPIPTEVDTASRVPAWAGDGRSLSEAEQVSALAALRREIVVKYRPLVESVPSPIRVMARMVKEIEATALKMGISSDMIAREVVNRTIGDVNVRMITEKIDDVDYTTIGEDLGLILPGEEIGGRISDGRVKHELYRRQEEIERRLLNDYNWDMRVYDVWGVGNPLLREKLAHTFERTWGIPTDPNQTFISIGALDALYKSILALGRHFRQEYGAPATFAFPSPGFAVVNWQVEVSGLNLLNFHTLPENNFKLTYEQMKGMLAANEHLRLLYFTVSNNPTAFSYSPEEIAAVYRAIEEDGREFAVLADLAYIGTGIEAEDRARMAALNNPFALDCTLFINSLSKVYTLTGDRCGWVSMQKGEYAELLRVAWNNITAGLPAEWQLRFAAYLEWFEEHPEIQKKIKDLYALRRDHLRGQLIELNKIHNLFEEIGLDDRTAIYNWSKLKPGVDALDLFEKTGIAGVPGSAFGYDDSYIRFSVGFIPIQ